MPQITDNDARILREMLAWIRNFRGAGVSNTPGGASVAPTPAPRTQRPSPFRVLIAKVTTSISGQVGRVNLRIVRPNFKSNATGNLAATDIDTTSLTKDDAIGWEIEAVQAYRIGIPVGVDTTSGKTIIALLPRGLFPVKLTVAGGANGTGAAPATYTYDVKTLAGDLLASAVSLARPRMGGECNSTNGYGMAFYDGATLKLWDAGETPSITACS